MPPGKSAALAAWLVVAPVLTAAAQTPAPEAAALLARDVGRAQAVRNVKLLQYGFDQFALNGLWDKIGPLFAAQGELVWGADTIKTRAAIVRYLRAKAGAPGDLNAFLDLVPVVVLAADGMHATGRWRQIGMLSRAEQASWTGGIEDNDYMKEGGAWKIARLHYTPTIAGPYESGWHDTEADSKIVPYRYGPAQAGTPAPDTEAPPPPVKNPAASFAQSVQRIDAMNDEDQIRNLQNMYGYYIDRKMWDDVVDLFHADGSFTIAGVGTWLGHDGVRRALEQDGPAGLKHGQLNDHLQLDVTVTVDPDGKGASARGFDWGMLGEADSEKGIWSFATFDNRYIKVGNVWEIQRMRLSPVMRADYALGWGKSKLSWTLPGDKPDMPELIKPQFLAHAVLLPPPAATISLAEARRRLAVSKAYDAVENISDTFGSWIDDQQWDDLGSLMAAKGSREEPGVGVYIGHDHIAKAETLIMGAPRPLRPNLQFHLRVQPVIHVSADGKSVKLRTRLVEYVSSFDPSRAGSFSSGMYPNDQALLENGVWKFWSVAIDEHYFQSAGYQGGWAHAKDPPPGTALPRLSPVLTSFPPDIALTDLGVREEGLTRRQWPPWPAIGPMWFSTVNPVTGRVPPLYWPDCISCVTRPDTRLPK